MKRTATLSLFVLFFIAFACVALNLKAVNRLDDSINSDGTPLKAIQQEAGYEPLTEPVILYPSPTEAEMFTTSDMDNDGNTWTYAYYKYILSKDNEGNEWLFLPAIKFEDAAHAHNLTFDCYSNNNSEAAIEVYIGKSATPEAMTNVICEKTTVNWGLYANNINQNFSISENGVYYIGIKGFADKEYDLTVSNFVIKALECSANGPEAISDAIVTAADLGELRATVKFIMPTLTVTGETLDENVKAVVTSDVESKEVSGAPGSEQSVEIATVQGNNTIKVQTFAGEADGKISKLNVFTGMDAPGKPVIVNVKMNADNCSGTITWNTPDKGANGGYLASPSELKYYLCQYDFDTWTWNVIKEVGKNILETEFELTSYDEPTTCNLGVYAENEQGKSDVGSVSVVAGKPYQSPVWETFFNGSWATANYKPLNYYSGSDSDILYYVNAASAELDSKYATEDDAVLFGSSYSEKGYGFIELPKFSTSGLNKVALTPRIYTGSFENFKVTAESYDEEEVEIYDFSQDNGEYQEGYNDIMISLPEKFQNKGWITLRLYTYFQPGNNLFVMDGYRLRDIVNNDLGVRFKDVVKPFVGKPAEFNIEVHNNGIETTDFQGAVFTLTDEEENIVYSENVSGGSQIEPEKSITLTCTYVPSIEHVGTLTATITLDGTDDNSSNNQSSTTCLVKKGQTPIIEDLSATKDGENVVLQWSEPTVVSGYESFEEYAAFKDYTEIGEFTQIHPDDIVAYMWQRTEIEPLSSMLQEIKTKPGFYIYDSPRVEEAFEHSVLYPAAEGEQFLIAFCPNIQANGEFPPADDWLISPTVQGESEISFKVRALRSDYGEELIELCYSTEDSKNPQDFKVLRNIDVDNDNWETITATLPADAVRFALHYVSEDIYGVCVDEIQYVPQGGEVGISSYKILRSIGTSDQFDVIDEVSDCNFVDATANLHAVNSYKVIPVLSNGKNGNDSNIAEIDFTSGISDITTHETSVKGGIGDIIIKCSASDRITIATIDGKTVANRVAGSEKQRICVSTGIYVVKIGNKVYKVIVK